MTDYRRIYAPSVIWFFTVNLAERKGNQLLLEHIEKLRESLIKVGKDHRFKVVAIVVFPDHLHYMAYVHYNPVKHGLSKNAAD